MARKYKKIPKSLKILLLIIVGLSIFIETFFKDIINDYLRINVKAYKSFTSSYYGVNQINSIHDGDTINIINENGKKVKIRLYGIDAPEIKQSYGENSRKCLEEMIKGKQVSYAIEDIDKYKRIVATIYADNKNINYEMIKKGCAWSYFQYSNSIRNEYAQLKAKINQKGLWQESNPQAPWQYRKERK